MVADFIKSYAELIVIYPELLKISTNEVDDTFTEVTIIAHPDDVGKLIGKNGNMINSIKTIVNGCKAKDGKSYKIQVLTA